MRCKKIYSLFSESIDNELDSQTQFLIEKHIAQCRDCAEKYHVLKQIKSVVSKYSPDKTNLELEDKIMEHIETIPICQKSWRNIAFVFASSCIAIILTFFALAPRNHGSVFSHYSNEELSANSVFQNAFDEEFINTYYQ